MIAPAQLVCYPALARNLSRNSSKVALLLCLRYCRLKGEKSGRGGGRGVEVQWTVELMVLSCPCLPLSFFQKGIIWVQSMLLIRVLYSSRLAHSACSVYSCLPLRCLACPPTTPSPPDTLLKPSAAHVKPNGSSATIPSPSRPDSARLPLQSPVARLVREISQLCDKI